MSYLALARKHRPQTFEEIVGQSHVSRTLQNAIGQDKVHHAFLFTGTRGVGKTTAARVLAKALNCEKGPTPTPCNECRACTEITNGSSVDVLEIDGASNRGIDDVRELRESVRYMPSGSRYRLVIIDEVHMLTREAFNALLKTLEEPPAHVKFILATTDPHRVPDTILSRVQRFDFREIPAAAMHEYLKGLTEKEGTPFTDDNLTLIVRKARGSMRDGLSLLDQAISFGGADIPARELADLLGITDWRHLLSLTEAVLSGEAAIVLTRFEDVFQYAYDIRQFYVDLLQQMRNLVIARVAGDPKGLVEATAEEVDELQRLAGTRSAEHLQMLFKMLTAAEDEVLRSAAPKLVLEMTLLGMATVRPVVAIDDLLGRIAALEDDETPPAPSSPAPSSPAPASGSSTAKTSAQAPPAAKKQAKAEEASAQAPVPNDPMGAMRHHLEPINPALAGMISDEMVQGVEVDGDAVTVRAKTPFFYDKITAQTAVEALETAVVNWLGDTARVQVVPPEKKAAAKPKRARENADQSAKQVRAKRQAAVSHPVVQRVVDLFDGVVEDVKLEGLSEGSRKGTRS